jgi:hypothetical protein
LPARREYPAGFADHSSFYVVGGGVQMRGDPVHWQRSGDCYRLDRSNAEAGWQTCGKLNVARSQMAAARVGDYLVTAEGSEFDFRAKDPYQRRDTTEVLNLRHPERGWQLRKPIPGPARGWSAGASCAGRLWVIGGIRENPQQALSDNLSYDPMLDRWTARRAFPVAGHSWGAVCYQNRYAIVIGGVLGLPDFIWSDLAFAYDIREDRWLRVDKTIPGSGVMSDVGVAIAGDTVYAAGAEGPKGTHFDYFLIGRIHGKAE